MAKDSDKEKIKLKKWNKLRKEVKGFALMRQWVRAELEDYRDTEMLKTQTTLVSNYQHLTNILSCYGVHDLNLPEYILDMSKYVIELQLNTYGIDPENFL